MSSAVAVPDRSAISMSECLRLLQSTRLGRVTVGADGRRELVPVIYSIHGDAITFRAPKDSAVSNVPVESCVLFEADGLLGDVAWRVSVQGLLRSVDEPSWATHLRVVTLIVRSMVGDRFALDDRASWAWW